MRAISIALCILCTGAHALADEAANLHAPSGAVRGRLLEETVLARDADFRVCVSLRNTLDRTLYVTENFREQIITLPASTTGEWDITHIVPGQHANLVPPPFWWERSNYFGLDAATRIETCSAYRYDNFSFAVLRIQSEFESWLMPEYDVSNVFGPYTTPEERPLRHNEVLYSNVCMLDRVAKTVKCD